MELLQDKPFFAVPSAKTSQLNKQFEAEYQLESHIGSGGYGFVMSAIHRKTLQKVAVKFIYKRKLPLASSIQQVPTEVSILQQIQHPKVVKYIDSYEDDDYHYLVMELYGCEWSKPSSYSDTSCSSSSRSSDSSSDGDSDCWPSTPPQLNGYQMHKRSSSDLFECIENHSRLTEAQTRSIIRQLVECISDLSDLGIYHRDIKDENVVIDSDFQVKLVDFGSAIKIPSDCSSPDKYTINKFYGTIAFASPEILLGLNYRPEPAEIWSLGILLFTLLHGEVPFTDSTQTICGNWARQYQKPICSESCFDLLDGLLKNNPSKRLTIKQVLQHPWLN